MNYKRLVFFFAASAVLFVLSSCTGKKGEATREERIEEFRKELTTQDTVAMLNLCDDAMEQLKQKNYDQVLANLFEYNDSTKEVTPLSENAHRRYERMFKMFPVMSYMRQYYSFMLEGCNDVKYEVTFVDAEHTGTGKPATTMYMFNPVKIGGEWKLCVKTAADQFDTEQQ